MGHFIFLQNTVSVPAGIAAPPGDHAVDVIDQYELAGHDLSNADGVLLSQHLDEQHLIECAPMLDRYLRQGGSISLNGPVYQPYLNGLGCYAPLPSGKAQDWILRFETKHRITDGLIADDLTYRQGVIGFWARGSFPPPLNSTVLTRMIGDDTAADFVWHRDGGGRVVVHPGNDVWFVHNDATSAGRFYANMLDWMAEERSACA
ncbi:MAG: hypothetical protein AAF234_04095 [Pseudomonadota bacterium]